MTSNHADNLGRSSSAGPNNSYNNNVDDSRINIDSVSRRSRVEVHHVRLPPDVSTIEKLKSRLSEIFFPDDPFFKVKNHSFCGKVLFSLKYFIPILNWLPRYRLKMLRSDLISGITIASLAIPQVCFQQLPKHFKTLIPLLFFFLPELCPSFNLHE